jgi:hypothetical protein
LPILSMLILWVLPSHQIDHIICFCHLLLLVTWLLLLM